MKNHKFKILKILIFFLCVPIINTSILAMSAQMQSKPEAISAPKPAQIQSDSKAPVEAKVEAQKDSCRICLTEFEPENLDEKINKLNCSHIFHKPCIEQWYSKSGNITCPLCRSVNTEILEAFKAAVDTNDIEIGRAHV